MRISDWSSDVCSSDLIIFIFARFFAGLAVGAASVLAPVYISEVTPASIRGRLSSVQQVMIIAGLTGAFLVKDRKRVVSGKSVSVRVDLGGSRIIKNKKP